MFIISTLHFIVPPPFTLKILSYPTKEKNVGLYVSDIGSKQTHHTCCDQPALIYNGILFSHKKDEILSMPRSWMELEVIMLNEVSKNHMISLIRAI